MTRFFPRTKSSVNQGLGVYGLYRHITRILWWFTIFLSGINNCLTQGLAVHFEIYKNPNAISRRLWSHSYILCSAFIPSVHHIVNCRVYFSVLIPAYYWIFTLHICEIVFTVVMNILGWQVVHSGALLWLNTDSM